MAITDQEYEDAYAEALVCLADDGHTVGIPFANGTGIRRCEADSRSLDDESVLETVVGRDCESNPGRTMRSRSWFENSFPDCVADETSSSTHTDFVL